MNVKISADWLTVREVARMLSKKRSTIEHYILTGLLSAQKFGTVRAIHREDAERLRDNPPPGPGRPPRT